MFDNNFSSTQFPHEIINQFAKDWLSANINDNVKDKLLFLVAWVPPGEDWNKLNTNGSWDKNSGHISAGGVMRNKERNWLKGFVLSKGIGNVLEAELWGMFEGLNMAWNSRARRVIMEFDSLTTVQLLTKDTNPNHPLFSLIQNCKRIVAADWNYNVVHVFREGNK